MSNCLIVLNYNDADTTLYFLESVVGMSALSNIVVVDNCSTDDSYERLCEWGKSYLSDSDTAIHQIGDKNTKIGKIIRTDKNGGYAYGNNFGCRYAIERFAPEVLFISNPDVRFDERTVSRMTEVMYTENPTISQPDRDCHRHDGKLCAESANNEFDIAVVAPVVNQGYNVWHLPNYWGVIRSIFLVAFNVEKRRIKKSFIGEEDDEYMPLLAPVGVVEGSFFAIRTDAYVTVGGFDERTFLYYEESILAKRLKDAGYSEAVIPSLRYDHFHSVSVSKAFGSKARAFKNFKMGMRLYLAEYLKTGAVGMTFFEICFALGYLERLVYDLIGGYKISRRVGNSS